MEVNSKRAKFCLPIEERYVLQSRKHSLSGYFSVKHVILRLKCRKCGVFHIFGICFVQNYTFSALRANFGGIIFYLLCFFKAIVFVYRQMVAFHQYRNTVTVVFMNLLLHIPCKPILSNDRGAEMYAPIVLRDITIGLQHTLDIGVFLVHVSLSRYLAKNHFFQNTSF